MDSHSVEQLEVLSLFPGANKISTAGTDSG